MKLALGTVQFGTNYGVANIEGQVNLEEARRILAYAASIGIDVLDTAAAYGQSELVLGEIGIETWKVITKIPPLPGSVEHVAEWVYGQVESSMKRLGVSKLTGVLLHRPDDILGSNGKEYIYALNKIQDSGKVDLVGYSVYSPSILEDLCKTQWPGIVQAPFNVFDQRIRSTGWMDRLQERDVKVHARSVLLQGLLLMHPDRIPAYFRGWANSLERWHKMINEAEASPLELALNFVNSVQGFDRIVVGVDSLEQLKEMYGSIGALDTAHLNLAELSCDDTGLIEPFRWKI